MLSDVLEKSFRQYRERPALWIQGQHYTYAEIRELALAIAARTSEASSPLAIFSRRTVTAYAGILAAALTSRPYVILNSRDPLPRLIEIFNSVEARDIVGDAGDVEILRGNKETAHPTKTAGLPREGLAYILFTSGTTGKPKGVPISQSNLLAYLKNAATMIAPDCENRFLQIADLNFDISVHDIFVAWTSGACIYSVPEGRAALVDRLIQDLSITAVMMVPSTAALIKAEGRLLKNSFPSLRHSIFSGAALPVSLARAWQQAAPHSSVWNFYGPTEATVSVSGFRWDESRAEEFSDTVPIGCAFTDQHIAVVDDTLNSVPRGQLGEILLSGSQVAENYWKDPVASQKFVQRPGDSTRKWYRTGDFAVDTKEHGLVFRGRTDQQIKVRGYRVEIQEIEKHIRHASQSEVAVIAWPLNNYGMAQGTVAFVVAPQVSEKDILAHCKTQLPEYMIPTQVIPLTELPLNANGKTDYGKLVGMAQDASSR